MTIWHKNGTEDMTQWTKCRAPEPCTCNTDCPASCKWFAMCENYAVTTRYHPILGDVDICNRCNEKIARIGRSASYGE